jgi:hypothetical protein
MRRIEDVVKLIEDIPITARMYGVRVKPRTLHDDGVTDGRRRALGMGRADAARLRRLQQLQRERWFERHRAVPPRPPVRRRRVMLDRD